MLAAGPLAACRSSTKPWRPAGGATNGGWRLAHCAPPPRPLGSYLNTRKTMIWRIQRGAAQHRLRKPCSAELNTMDFDFSATTRRPCATPCGAGSTRTTGPSAAAKPLLRPAGFSVECGRPRRTWADRLAVPEAHGGMGWGPVEAMVAMEELGRGLVARTAAQAPLIAPPAGRVRLKWPRNGCHASPQATPSWCWRTRSFAPATALTAGADAGARATPDRPQEPGARRRPNRRPSWCRLRRMPTAGGTCFIWCHRASRPGRARPYALHDGSSAAELHLAPNTPAPHRARVWPGPAGTGGRHRHRRLPPRPSG